MIFQVCICGWHSEGYPDGTTFIGLGGILDCPKCREEKRNPTLECCYGNVEVVNHIELFRIKFADDPEAAFKKVQQEHWEKERKEVMEMRERELEEKALRPRSKSVRIVSKFKGRGKFKKKSP
jgi:hypothetical protein